MIKQYIDANTMKFLGIDLKMKIGGKNVGMITNIEVKEGDIYFKGVMKDNLQNRKFFGLDGGESVECKRNSKMFSYKPRAKGFK